MGKDVTPAATISQSTPPGSSPSRESSREHVPLPASEALDSPSRMESNTLSRISSGPPYSVFDRKTKIFIVGAVSVSALISPFGATLFYPALNVLSKELHVSSGMINLAITTYMIAQAIAPSIFGGMSDSSGRRVSFMICFVIYTVANIGLALQTNFAALLVLRCLQAAGCSAAIALSLAVVADIATSAERGTFMGYATAGILVGPAFGPTLGGILAQGLGWRSIFWFLAIFSGVLLVIFAFFFPETCRQVVGNGSIPAKGLNQSILGHIQQRKAARENQSVTESQLPAPAPAPKRKLNLPNPLLTLKILKDKESAIVLFYSGFFFTGMMVVSTALPSIFKDTYHYDELTVGLCFISIGFGSLLAALTMGRVVDWNFRRHAARLNMPIIKGKQQDLRDFPIERARLEVVAPGHAVGTAAIIAFGWSIEYKAHIAVPEVILFFVGFGISSAFNIANTLLLDIHRDQAATATAAMNLVRCLISAGGVAAIVPMMEAMTAGWAFTFIGLVYTVFITVVFWIMKNGQRWRSEAISKKEEAAAREKAAEDAETSGDRAANESRILNQARDRSDEKV